MLKSKGKHQVARRRLHRSNQSTSQEPPISTDRREVGGTLRTLSMSMGWIKVVAQHPAMAHAKQQTVIC